MGNRAVEQLRRLLQEEREALLTGDLATVGAMVAEKESLTQKIEATNPLELKLLSEDLARNGALLAAAKMGVDRVIATLRDQRAARMSLSTYNSDGQPTKISQPVGKTERRF